jgi:hypothetical protein
MLGIRRTAPVMMSISLLAGVMLFLPGMMRTPLGMLAAAERPVSFVTGEPAGPRPQATRVIASPARPVGYDAHVADPTDTDPARYVGLIESGGAGALRRANRRRHAQAGLPRAGERLGSRGRGGHGPFEMIDLWV